MASTIVETNPKFRWEQALRDARASGLQLAENVASCCAGCVTTSELGFDNTKPFAWTPGFQGQGYEWLENEETVLHFDDDSESDDDEDNYYNHHAEDRTYLSAVDQILFHHNNGGAVMIVTAFIDNGFEVSWDGSAGSCVAVQLS